MDQEECYKWGDLFSGERDALVSGMAARAGALGLSQDDTPGALVWKKDEREYCRWVFVDDPSEVERIREIYADNENIQSPCCYVVVKQDDPSDTRGEILFDIFRLNPQSYLWHFNRVYTPPRKNTGL